MLSLDKKFLYTNYDLGHLASINVILKNNIYNNVKNTIALIFCCVNRASRWSLIIVISHDYFKPLCINLKNKNDKFPQPQH